MNITQLLSGFLLSLGVAFIAYKKEKLTLSGLISAILLGTIVYGFGTWIFYIWLMIFFMSSLLIQKFVVVLLPEKHTEKHGARNWIQVFANGGILGFISIIYYIYPTNLVIFAAALSMAASTSDTWASEIGSFSSDIPYGLICRKSITRGLSGGVTRLGLWASFWGSTLISLTYFAMMMMMSGYRLNLLFMAILCCLGGFMGSIVDSVLGELVQAKYLDDHLEVVESKHNHHEKLIHGYSWLDNNMVNLLSNLIVVSLFSALLSMTGWIK